MGEYKRPLSARMRHLIMDDLSKGKTVREVADRRGVNRSTVYYYRKKLEDGHDFVKRPKTEYLVPTLEDAFGGMNYPIPPTWAGCFKALAEFAQEHGDKETWGYAQAIMQERDMRLSKVKVSKDALE